MLRLLVVEGNKREQRERRSSIGGKTPAQGYGDVLSNLSKQVIFDICTPADIGANLPDKAGLSDYDGIALTGSALNLYDMHPEITQQIELAKTALQSGTPIFGSCWGLQVLSAAAGGDTQTCAIRKNPQGREVPIARKICLNDAGINHAMFAGKPYLFDAPAIHLDEVALMPREAKLLASNHMSQVQAYELIIGKTVAWGVQYHPEYNMHDLSLIMTALKTTMFNEGFFKTEEAFEEYCLDFKALHDNPQEKALRWKYGFDDTLLLQEHRERELMNWIDHLVKPTKSMRGRA